MLANPIRDRLHNLAASLAYVQAEGGYSSAARMRAFRAQLVAANLAREAGGEYSRTDMKQLETLALDTAALVTEFDPARFDAVLGDVLANLSHFAIEEGLAVGGDISGLLAQ